MLSEYFEHAFAPFESTREAIAYANILDSGIKLDSQGESIEITFSDGSTWCQPIG